MQVLVARQDVDRGQSVRLIDASGASGNAGLLQVRMGSPEASEFGTVCGMDLVRGFVCVTVCFILLVPFGCDLGMVFWTVRPLPMSCAPNWGLILASSERVLAKVMEVLTFVGPWAAQS